MADSSFTVTAVEGNRQLLDGGAMFGNAPKALWERWAAPDAQNRIPLACRTLLIRAEDKLVLCETGIGAFFDPKKAGRYGVQEPERHLLLENLAALGVKPGDIDAVILSHLHFDHAGGLLPTFREMRDGNAGLVFPKARFIVGREAWERATHPHPRDKASFIPDLPAKLKATGRLEIVDGAYSEHLPPNRFSFRFTSGHTPGHMHTVFKGNTRTVFFAGDLIPGAAWVHLPITMGYDRYPEQLIDEKRRIYKNAVPENWLVCFTHDPEVCAATIGMDDSGKFKAESEVQELLKFPA